MQCFRNRDEAMTKQGRNDPCACGSGKKFKQCCMDDSQAVAIAPKDIAIANALKVAASHVGAGRLQDAVLTCQKILQAEPNHHEALNLLGVLAFYDGNNPLALHLLNKAISVNPKYADAHNNIAEVYRSSGKFQQAILHLQYALKFKPNYIDALINYGNVLQDVYDYEKALEMYYHVLKINPKHTGSLSNITNLLQQLNRHGEALRFYNQLLSIDEDYDWALGGCLYTKLNCCNWENYKQDLDKVLSKVLAGKM